MKGRRHGEPGPAHRWLLRAALLRGEEAVQAWAVWRNTFDLDRADPASQQLFPLLAYNLLHHGISDTWSGKLKGHYRRAWYQNQLVLAEVDQVERALAGIGVRASFLGDLAFATTYYDKVALRPLNRPALLISQDDLGPAAEQLQCMGYDPAPHFPLTLQRHHFIVRHFYGFRRGRMGLRLYWRPWAAPRGLHLDSAAPRAVAAGRDAAAPHLHPIDHLLHLAAGYGSSPRGSCLVLADLFSIVRAEGKKLDWEQLLGLAAGLDLLPALSAMLLQLHENLGVDVPPGVNERGGGTATSVIQRLSRAGLAPRPVQQLLVHWQRYCGLRQSAELSLSFPHYLQHLWGLPSPGQLSSYLLRRARHRV